MGEEFYSIIKLISGEEIFSLVCIDENDGDPVIVLQNPVIIKSFINNHGSFIKIKPWIEMSSEDIFVIKLDKIITMTETHNQKLIKLYENYLESDNDNIYSPTGEVTLSDKMGYISTVEEARKRLENLFKNNKDLN